jgi:hypothetical protein
MEGGAERESARAREREREGGFMYLCNQEESGQRIGAIVNNKRQ